MLIVLTSVAMIGIIAAIIICKCTCAELAPIFLGVISVMLVITSLIGFCACGSALVEGRYIDDKIEMYQSENAKIETQAAETIEAYLAHEKGILGAAADKVEPGSSLTIIAAYPELHSSELITKLVEVYNNNNTQIKELRAEKINLAIYRWWVYFG